MSKLQGAKIIESHQNIVELRKLIRRWDVLEKEKKKSIRLINTEENYLKAKFGELLQAKNSKLEESFLIPAGFRFRSNGEPRHMKDKLVVSSFKDLGASGAGDSGSREDLSASSHNRYIRHEDILTKKGIKETEKLIRDMNSNQELKEIRRKTAQTNSALTFIRAHANDTDLKRDYSSDIQFRAKDRALNQHDLKANCCACENRLRIESMQSGKKKTKEKLKRWNVAPSGTYIKAPLSNVSRIRSKTSPPRFQTKSEPVLKAKRALSTKIDHSGTKVSSRKKLGRCHTYAGSVRVSSQSTVENEIKNDVPKGKPKKEYNSLVDGPDEKSTEAAYWTVMCKSAISNENNLAVLKEMQTLTIKSIDERAERMLQRSPSQLNRRSSIHSSSASFVSSKTNSRLSTTAVDSASLQSASPVCSPMLQYSLKGKPDKCVIKSEIQKPTKPSPAEHTKTIVHFDIKDTEEAENKATEQGPKQSSMISGRPSVAGMGPRPSEKLSWRLSAEEKEEEERAAAMKRDKSRLMMKRASVTQMKVAQERMDDFLRRLPAPDVSIRRWRSSTGHNQKMADSCGACVHDEPEMPPELMELEQWMRPSLTCVGEKAKGEPSKDMDQSDLAKCRYLRLPSKMDISPKNAWI